MGAWRRTGSHTAEPPSQLGDSVTGERERPSAVAELMASLGPMCGPGGQQEEAHGWGAWQVQPPIALGTANHSLGVGGAVLTPQRLS